MSTFLSLGKAFQLVFCTLAYVGGSCASRHLQDSPGSSPAHSQELFLLEFADNLTNFEVVATQNHFNGWQLNSPTICTGTNQTVTVIPEECDPDNQIYKSADRNTWTGVTCNPSGEVICIHLAGLGLKGPVESLRILGGLPKLAYLNLGENKLTGPLSDNAGSQLSSLQILYLRDNLVNSTLGRDWGSEESWPSLQALYLQDNLFYGSLPDAWGNEGRWENLQTLNLSKNHLQGAIPGSYVANSSGWPALQFAYMQPGNAFCGRVPEGFPAVRSTGYFVTGATYDEIADFNNTCTSESDILIKDWSSGATDNLSNSAVAAIITGEVLLGTFLLLVSGTIHRRYRWRQERSWVLFDWDVVADAPPPRPFINFGARFGWGSSKSTSLNGLNPDGNALLGNGSQSPNKTSSNGLDQDFGGAAAGPQIANGHDKRNGNTNASDLPVGAVTASDRRNSSIGSFSDMIWQDSMLPPEEVVIQQNTDGSLRQLGNGSFGKVYKGVLQEVHEVAVKVFEGYVGQREQELLLKEISILRSCRNKNIVQFFGVTFHDNDIWMIMELMDGNLFRHLARGHHCTWYFRGRSIAIDIARGMHFLHSRRIIHMDLKSPNILLGSSGTAKIADVGLARVMGSESIANQVCAGTMHWMAPEVLIHGRCTEKADIFSFGVILWEICTAEAPSRGRMSIVSVPDECPEEVAQLIEWCMAEEPDKRPSALDIIHKIQAIPVTSRPVPQPPWYAR